MEEKLKLRNFILKTVAEIFAVDERDVVDNADFVADLEGDSLDVFETAFAVEEEFNLSLDELDLSNVNTVGDLIKLFEAIIAPAQSKKQLTTV